MTALPRSRTPADDPRSRRVRRQDLGVLAAATAIGLWLGLGAPSVSPVAPTGPATTLTVAVPGPPDGAGTAGGGR